MELQTWKITGGPFHFGRHGLGLEEASAVFTSDSLTAALAACLSHLESPEEVDAWASASHDWLLTSAFPFAGRVRFFPTPSQSSQTGRLCIRRSLSTAVRWQKPGLGVGKQP